MRKKSALFLSMIMLAATVFTGCGKSNNSSSNGNEIALVVATGSVDDKSFNQGAWNGIKEYAQQNEVSHKFYQSVDSSSSAISNTIDLAVLGGAKIVVCPGFAFQKALFDAQSQYPDVTFVMLDGAPTDTDGTSEITSNTATYTYAEEEAGFLAGYAAIMDGYRNLGFMGGVAMPAVVRFGYGFVQGADYAAKELGLSSDEVSMNYTYVGSFDASPDIAVKASAWYNNGTEVIFACGGSIGNSVMSAADQAGTKVIGVDIDQSSESETVITSAVKNIEKTVYDAVGEFYEGTLVTGGSETLDVTSDSVLLPLETSRFTQFSKEQYDAVYQELVNKNIEIANDTDCSSASELPVDILTVNELN